MNNSGPAPAHAAPAIRVMVIDDHPIVAESLTAILEREGDAEVVTRATCGADGIERHRPVQPDVTVLDRNLPDMDGVDVAAAILAEQPDARILMLSADADPRVVRRAIEIGCIGYLLKTACPDELRAAVRDAAHGKLVMPAELGAQLAASVRDASRSVDSGLSPRETEILSLLCDGLDPAAIAQQLHVSPLTVKTHLARLYAKLDVHDRAAAVAKAFRDGLVER